MRHSHQTSILVVRLSAIGDIVMSSPVAAAIKKKWPHSRLTWIVHPECEPLLNGNPHIDELIVWDKKHWKHLLKKRRYLTVWKELRQLRKTLRARRFDLAIDLQGLMKSGFLAWLSGAKHRVGLGCQEGSTMLMTKSISRNLGDLDQIGSEYRYLVNQLGMPDSPWDMVTPVSADATQAASTLLQNHIGNQAFAIFCPFTTRPQKHWPDDHWRQLGLRLPEKYRLKLIILGGPTDRDKAEEIAAGCGAVNLAGQTSLQEAAAIIRRASLLVGVDTGLTHMGHAAGIPTLALFGSTCPYTYTGLDTSKVLYLDLPCSPCRRNPTCGGTFDCMRDITPEFVLTEIKSLID